MLPVATFRIEFTPKTSVYISTIIHFLGVNLFVDQSEVFLTMDWFIFKVILSIELVKLVTRIC